MDLDTIEKLGENSYLASQYDLLRTSQYDRAGNNLLILIKELLSRLFKSLVCSFSSP